MTTFVDCFLVKCCLCGNDDEPTRLEISDLAAGTRSISNPDDWCCPACFYDMFCKIEFGDIEAEAEYPGTDEVESFVSDLDNARYEVMADSFSSF